MSKTKIKKNRNKKKNDSGMFIFFFIYLLFLKNLPMNFRGNEKAFQKIQEIVHTIKLTKFLILFQIIVINPFKKKKAWPLRLKVLKVQKFVLDHSS